MRTSPFALELLVIPSLVALAACGDESPGRADSASGPIVTTSSTAGDTEGETEGPGETAGTDGSDGAGSTGGEPGSADSDTDTADTMEVKFDLGGSPDGGSAGCGNGDSGEGNVTFSYIWIANSSQGTVSKIDTVTGIEVGRYRTSESGSDSPSRTSVNQFGDVAVGNRVGGGGITKIAAVEERCEERNGQPGIQTSTGPDDVLPFMEDECVLWHTPLPVADYGPRGVAWEGGELDPVTCTNTVPNPRLWISYGGGSREIYRLDGDTGDVLDHIALPGVGGYIYGGAVNGEGDYWTVTRGGRQLVHVDSETLDTTTYATPGNPYGMGVDENGDPWIVTYSGGAGADHVYRLDTVSGQFVDAGGANGYYRGMNLDREGRNWVAGNSPCRLAAFDAQSDTLIADDIALPGCSTPVGVSIDFDGFVWVVDQNGTAFKVHPETHAIELTVTGLVGPYTYSDMTGAGLDLVVNPPG